MALQRAAMDEIAKLDYQILRLLNRIAELEALALGNSQPERSTPE